MPRKSTKQASMSTTEQLDDFIVLEEVVNSVAENSKQTQVMFTRIMFLHPAHERLMYAFSPLTMRAFSQYLELNKTVLVYARDGSLDGNEAYFINVNLVQMYGSI